MANKRIGEVNKNSVEKIVFEIREYKGRTFIDVRTYFLYSDNEYIATKKGVTIAPDIAKEALEIFAKAVDELN